MSEPRVIKKYPNRRLYDTAESRYITLADVRRLVIENIDFVVIDKKNQQDITRSILLQVIAEQEHSAQPMMSRDFLSQVIRSYGDPAHDGLAGYLEQSMRQFPLKQQNGSGPGTHRA
jgi:polyhydroxyalkanoate synthesis repressor PhaR